MPVNPTPRKHEAELTSVSWLWLGKVEPRCLFCGRGLSEKEWVESVCRSIMHKEVTFTPPEIRQLLEGEEEWHKEHGGIASKSYEMGFVAGLRQAYRLMGQAKTKISKSYICTAAHSVYESGEKCPDCKSIIF